MLINVYLGTVDIHVGGVELEGGPPLDAALEVHGRGASLCGAASCSSSLPAVQTFLFPREVYLVVNF